jgi:hypothetical protein
MKQKENIYFRFLLVIITVGTTNDNYISIYNYMHDH